MKAHAQHAPAAHDKAAGRPKSAGAHPATKAPGGCGTGAGGFKAGNTCGCHGKGDGPDDAPGPLAQDHPDVQRAHARIARSQRRDTDDRSDGHSHRVALILRGKDGDGKIAKNHPKAREDADALRSYEPATGHVAVGLRPGRPDEAEARAISRLQREQAKGKPLNEHELAAVADRDASHVPAPDRRDYDESTLDGHRFLVHNRLDGTNIVLSERQLRKGTKFLPAHDVPLRQFDSHGVEVPLDADRYRRSARPEGRPAKAGRFVQGATELDREFLGARGVRRARFGTAEPKY